MEKSAQKASSVSPAHFKSALQHAKRILSSIPPETRRLPRASSSSNTSNAVSAAGSSLTQVSPAKSPFQTPKKKFKSSSGVDLSGLSKSPHEPIKGSPLKQSLTPSKSANKIHTTGEGSNGAGDDGKGRSDGEGGVGGVSEEEISTPTKRKHPRRGVDLENIQAEGSEKRQRVDTSAFFALRPGSGASAASPVRTWTPIHDDDGFEARLPEVDQIKDGKKAESERKEPRRDWTYSERVWGSEAIVEGNKRILETVRYTMNLTDGQLWNELPPWLEREGIPLPSQTLDSVEAILLSSISPGVEAEG